MPDNIIDIESLLSSILTDLAALGLGDAVAAIRADGHAFDATRAEVLFGCGQQIRPCGRAISLRTACRWMGEGLLAHAAGNADEAQRWAEKAKADIDRYHEVDSAPQGAAAVAEICGGAE